MSKSLDYLDELESEAIYILRVAGKTVPKESDGSMKLNDICKVLIRTAEAVGFDSYADNRTTGSFILINEHSNNTIAAGTID